MYRPAAYEDSDVAINNYVRRANATKNVERTAEHEGRLKKRTEPDLRTDKRRL
jgi:hypothetical protein